MNSLLKIGFGVFVFLFLLSFYSSCNRGDRYRDAYNVTVQQNTLQDASSGLDLRAVGELVKEAETAEDFERLLNSPAVGINNLDLDEDGRVDYIQVTEYGEGDVKGFSLTTELSPDETQELATIEIERTAEGQARMETYGNQHIYGPNHYYHSTTSLTDVLLLSWLFSSNRPYYSSPWGYNSYPRSYSPYAPSPYDYHQRRVATATRSSDWSPANRSTLSSSPSSPNAGRNADTIKAPLKNPTTSQKAFQARNPSKQVRSGGFGRPSPGIRTSGSSSYRGGGK